MYLTPEAVEATLAVIDARSAEGSRLLVAYHARGWMLPFIGFLLRRLGEPLRSVYSPEAMRALLARYGYAVVEDADLPTLANRLATDGGADMRLMKHGRVVVANRRLASTAP